MTISILTSCATSREIMLPSGQSAIDVRCEGALSRCYKKAAKACPNGYELEEKVTSANFLESVYNLIIVCK